MGAVFKKTSTIYWGELWRHKSPMNNCWHEVRKSHHIASSWCTAVKQRCFFFLSCDRKNIHNKIPQQIFVLFVRCLRLLNEQSHNHPKESRSSQVCTRWDGLKISSVKCAHRGRPNFFSWFSFLFSETITPKQSTKLVSGAWAGSPFKVPLSSIKGL